MSQTGLHVLLLGTVGHACVVRVIDLLNHPPLLLVTDNLTVSSIVAVSRKGISCTEVPCIMPQAAQAVIGAIETHLQLGYIHKLH